MFSVVLKEVLLVGSAAGCYNLISETNWTFSCSVSTHLSGKSLCKVMAATWADIVADTKSLVKVKRIEMRTGFYRTIKGEGAQQVGHLIKVLKNPKTCLNKFRPMNSKLCPRTRNWSSFSS